MSTHNAVATVGLRARLAIVQVPTVSPQGREVTVHVQWTASTPLDLHQNDGGLLVTHPQVLGDSVAGTVVKVGPDVKNLAIGDKVFGFSFKTSKEKAYQDYATVNEYLLGKVPAGYTLQEAVTLPNNVVTAFHAITTDLELPLPWPRPANPSPAHANTPILIWGGSSSAGQYTLQILRYWGYTNLLTTASAQHHALLRALGAKHTFDYRDPGVASKILESIKPENSSIPFIFDCIGSQSGSLVPLAMIAQSGSKMAVLLPVVVKDVTDTEAPEYAMDVQASANWAPGVIVRGVRTHFYDANEFFKENLQSQIVPQLLAEGVIKPNKQKIVEGDTLLERAQNAMDMLRRKQVSGERLVWRVSDKEVDI